MTLTFITLGPAKGGQATTCTLFVSPTSGASSRPILVLVVCPISEPLAGSTFAGVGVVQQMDEATDEGEKGFTQL
jgi:hypothetical protein